MSWGEIHRSRYVGKNDRIAREIVNLHDASRRGIQAKWKLVSNNKSNTSLGVAQKMSNVSHLESYRRGGVGEFDEAILVGDYVRQLPPLLLPGIAKQAQSFA